MPKDFEGQTVESVHLLLFLTPFQLFQLPRISRYISTISDCEWSQI